MHRACRWRGVVCLLVAVGAGVWFAQGCGATQNAAPTVAAGDLLTIETPSAFTFPKQMTVSVAGVVGSSTTSLSKALSADLGPGRHTLGQTLYTAHEDNARLEALLRIFSAISVPFDAASATGTLSAVGSTGAGGVWLTTFADDAFPTATFATLKSDTLTDIDCSATCSGKLEALPVCTTVYIGGKRAMFTKFFAYPSPTSYGKGCFYALTTVTSSTQEAAILDGSENYLIAGLWDGTDTTNPQIDMLSATTVADADGILNRGHRGVFASAITTATTVSTVNVAGDLTVATQASAVSAIHKFDETQDCASFTVAASSTESDSGLFDNTTGEKSGDCSPTLAITEISGVTAAAPPSLESTATTIPSVSATSPAADATDVSLNAPIAVTFSEAMATSTVTTATFTLTPSGGSAIAGTITTTDTTATLTPSADLAASTTYSAVLTTGMTNAGGTALTAQFSWSFTTGTAADTTAPTVSSTSPAAAATGVAITADITATFNEAMNASTLSTSTLSLTPTAGGAAIAGAVSYSGTVATFNPTGSLSNNTQYTATLTTGVTDTAGNALASASTWTFTTVAADSLPSLSGSYILSGPISVEFTVLTASGSNPYTLTNAENFAQTVLTFTSATACSDSSTGAGASGTPATSCASCSRDADTGVVSLSGCTGDELQPTHTVTANTAGIPQLSMDPWTVSGAISGLHTFFVPGHGHLFYALPDGIEDSPNIALWFTSSTACTADEWNVPALCDTCSRDATTGVISLTCPSGGITLTPP